MTPYSSSDNRSSSSGSAGLRKLEQEPARSQYLLKFPNTLSGIDFARFLAPASCCVLFCMCVAADVPDISGR